MKWSGDFDLQDVAQRLRIAAEAAAEEIAKDIYDLSQREVPTDDGELQASGDVSTDHSPTEAGAAISYDTEHAIIQHEYMGYAHDDGSAKYLERPMGTVAKTADQVLAKHVGRVLE